MKANQRDLHDDVHRIEDCLLRVRECMDVNYLKLNNDKIHVFLLGSRQQLNKVTLNGLNVCDIFVRAQYVSKDLGVLWDSQKTMAKQIAKVCKTSAVHL